MNIEAGAAYLGSGSLPTETIPSVMVSVSVPGLSASELARRLRLDEACVFSRIEDDLVRLDMRTSRMSSACHCGRWDECAMADRSSTVVTL